MSDHPTPVSGTCSARFEPLRELFAAKLESGEDLGASLALNIGGEMVVDLWGGWADEARTAPWTENTIACVFSTTKAMTALAALVLVDRGELDLDATVARYWPEFAAEGKAEIKVRQLLSHTSGVSGWDQRITLDDVYDWNKSTALLAAQAPWWEPGTDSGYHMLNYGHLIGEVIWRITGQRLGEFFAAHIAGPPGADFHIGLPPSEFHRVANIVVPPPAATADPPHFDPTKLDPNSVALKTWTNPTMPPLHECSCTEGWRRADIGAANGHGNARSVARLQAAVACGGEVDGIRLLSPQTIDRIFEVQSNGIDLVLGIPIKIGVGYSLLPEGRMCCWGGAGGSLVMIDVDRRMTFAYVMNKMAPGMVGPIAWVLFERAYDIVNR
ncbi:MAG TPA: serine hydrolase domain-containing protein [Chloroflexota bacterium]|nr:serine hydrolase domain-containing protein [Chloroflexota bacterium]